MTSIDAILIKNRAKLLGQPGNSEKAHGRLAISKLLAAKFEAFNQLRLHLFHPEIVPSLRTMRQETTEIADRLLAEGWIKAVGKDRSVVVVDPMCADPTLPLYLRGHWLEEYLFCALLQAGADECYFGQRIQWGDPAAPSLFEVDAIARSGNRVVFVSCKAISPRATAGRSTELRSFMSEALSWDHLFARGEAALLVATTADFVDARRRALRFAPLIEQAKCLGEVLIGEEHLPWDVLLPICETILEGGLPNVEDALQSSL